MLERIACLRLCVSVLFVYLFFFVFVLLLFCFLNSVFLLVCCLCFVFLFWGDISLSTYVIEAVEFSDLSRILLNLWKTIRN